MPTFNQLVRNGRQERQYKSKAPVLQKGFNSIKKSTTDLAAEERRMYKGYDTDPEKAELGSP